MVICVCVYGKSHKKQGEHFFQIHFTVVTKRYFSIIFIFAFSSLFSPALSLILLSLINLNRILYECRSESVNEWMNHSQMWQKQNKYMNYILFQTKNTYHTTKPRIEMCNYLIYIDNNVQVINILNIQKAEWKLEACNEKAIIIIIIIFSQALGFNIHTHKCTDPTNSTCVWKQWIYSLRKK